MRNLSTFIASTAKHGEDKPLGPWSVAAFVAVVIIGSAGAAFWIGNSMSNPASAQNIAPVEYADEAF